jgi:hypothetical protein
MVNASISGCLIYEYFGRRRIAMLLLVFLVDAFLIHFHNELSAKTTTATVMIWDTLGKLGSSTLAKTPLAIKNPQHIPVKKSLFFILLSPRIIKLNVCHQFKFCILVYPVLYTRVVVFHFSPKIV